MPELPEVESTRRRLERELTGKRIDRVVIRTAKLRLPVPPDLAEILPGQTLLSIGRRGKYLLFFCDGGCLVIHLGMTGFLRLVAGKSEPGKHDHLDIILSNGQALRFHDPRKFGTILWTDGDPLAHQLLANIGPEPLTGSFSANYLYDASRTRRVAVKQFIMNSSVVAGVGNIYANEALFRAGIRPDRPACSLDLQECGRLVQDIKDVLDESLAIGSTYLVAEGATAYHPLDFSVYGRGGATCRACGSSLESLRLGNRSTIFCPRCQV